MDEAVEKSWHLFTLLLRHGQPLSPQHLSSLCHLFPASPSLILHLISLPHSPLSLSPHGLLIPSPSLLPTFLSFFRFSNKRPNSLLLLPPPPPSKKTRFSFSQDASDPLHLSLPNAVSFQSYDRSSKANILPTFTLPPHWGNAFKPFHIDSTNAVCPPWNFEHMKADIDATTNMYQGQISRSLISPTLFLTGNDSPSQNLGNRALPTTFQHIFLCNEPHVGSSDEFGKKINTCEDPVRGSNEEECRQFECGLKEGLIGSEPEREKEDANQMVDLATCGEERSEPKKIKRALNFDNDETLRSIGTQSTFKIPRPSSKQYQKSSILKGDQKNESKKEQNTKHKLKKSRKENKVGTTSLNPKVEKKPFPSFEAFIIEEEEGSGGYGTVYRAIRKTDGQRLAIKCPHEKAHKSHINNERHMLERFGGKNFIIKFEDSLKSSSGDCFVLEHVEHDRPEVLKKEIGLIQLQWYGYCMFRALACLHREGVVHRDVKPGNFLFSRSLNKGYLIDFNLAMDLKQKYNIGSKSKPSLDASNNIHLPSGSAPLVQDKNLVGSKSLPSSKREGADYQRNSQLNRQVKQKAYTGSQKNCPDEAAVALLRAKGTDGSGITSAKDLNSPKAASAERVREMLPSQGRKELITYALKNSMPSANNSSIKGPFSQRKRVIAPSGKADGKIVYITPMPLDSSIIAAGLLRSRGDGRQKKEGSCVGTRGFRAPEVLLRSQFQGPKVDIWSAGITLLYMVIGKCPFTGEPEQNIKEIAKLRGTEELWEVAKLHDRELSFPSELFDDRYLQSWDIKSWCKIETKRPEFFEQIPKSFFDLLDKCLTVNPRNRISVEEVLRHEFFASCHEITRKQRMNRRD